MNKFHLFFKMSAPLIIMYLMFIGLGTGLILAIQIYFGNQNGISFMNQMTYMFCPVIMMTIAEAAPRLMDDTKPMNQLQQHSFPIQLLPISLKSRFLIILAVISVCCIASILITLPIEMIASWAEQTYFHDNHIHVGGIIESMIQTRVLPLFLVGTGIGLLWGTLFRSPYFAIIPIVGFLIFSFIKFTDFEVKQTLSLTATKSGICIIIAIICVLLSYQCFKRWQPANNGLLMI